MNALHRSSDYQAIEARLAARLGAALAELNYRVLLLDLDPQANLSLSLGFEAEETSVTSANILIENVALESAIRKTVPSIRDAGFELVRRGVTTIEEVLRVTSV